MDQPDDNHLDTALSQTPPSAPLSLPLPPLQQHLSPTVALSPLEIPEVVASIFCWLDDEIINRVVVLVCRQWFIWTRHRIFRDLYWNGNRNQLELEKDVLSRLVPFGEESSGDRRGPNRLFCQLGYGFQGSYMDKWDQLGAALLALSQRKDSRDTCADGASERKGPHCRKEDRNHDIRYLTITGKFQLDKHMLSILSGLSNLTSLTMKLDSYGMVSMPTILMSCPRLESLHMEMSPWVIISGSSWTEDGEEEQGSPGVNPQQQAQPWPEAGQSHGQGVQEGLKARKHQQHITGPLALRSLVLLGAHFNIGALENFLPFIPLLHRLQISAWLPYRGRPWHNDFPQLLQLVHTYCRHLQIVHFSFYGSDVTGPASDDMNAVLMFWPRMPELMMAALHFTPEFVQCLLTGDNDVLTTLELIGEDCLGLHQYLCTGARYLRHLKARRTMLPVENMDVYLRLTNGLQSKETTAGVLPRQQSRHGVESGSEAGSGQDQRQSMRKRTRDVWICRGLLTLHLAISPMSDKPQASRIVFGYISRVCPHLRELEICGPEGVLMHRKILPKIMCMTLEGGFCLLTRLKALERLVVGAVRMNLKLRHGDIEWMIGEKEDGRIEVDEVVEEGRAGGGEKKAAWCKVQLPNSASERIIAKNGWNTLLRQEKKLELVRMRNYRQWTSATDGEVEQTSLALPTASMSVRESKDQDGGLEESLQDLGLLKDVVQLLQELESTPTIRGDDGTRCWPYMRRMAIYSGNRQGETFKNEYERLLEAVIKTEKAKAEKNERRLFAGIRGLVEGFFQA